MENHRINTASATTCSSTDNRAFTPLELHEAKLPLTAYTLRMRFSAETKRIVCSVSKVEIHGRQGHAVNFSDGQNKSCWSDPHGFYKSAEAAQVKVDEFHSGDELPLES